MSHDTIGWVLDKDTSTRRVHLLRLGEAVGVVTEIEGQTLGVVQLDVLGLAALRAYVEQAWQALQPEQES